MDTAKLFCSKISTWQKKISCCEITSYARENLLLHGLAPSVQQLMELGPTARDVNSALSIQRFRIKPTYYIKWWFTPLMNKEMLFWINTPCEMLVHSAYQYRDAVCNQYAMWNAGSFCLSIQGYCLNQHAMWNAGSFCLSIQGYCL